MAETARPCDKYVYSGRSMTPYRCSRPGTIERGDKYYCKQHDPVVRAERNKIRDDAWRMKYEREKAERDVKDRILNAAPLAEELATLVLDHYDHRPVVHKLRDLAERYLAAAKGGA